MQNMDINEMSDMLALSDAARNTIVSVMDANKDKGEPRRWRKLSLDQLAAHAIGHLNAFFKRHEPEDAENALTRCAMIILKIEEERNEQEHN